jgi:hypothetical protein
LTRITIRPKCGMAWINPRVELGNWIVGTSFWWRRLVLRKVRCIDSKGILIHGESSTNLESNHANSFILRYDCEYGY